MDKIKVSPPTDYARLSLPDCNSLYFAVCAACDAFEAHNNKPKNNGAIGELIEGYMEAMDRLLEQLAEVVEAKARQRQ
jgi:hypothetical protein